MTYYITTTKNLVNFGQEMLP